jgi:methionyl-tRNA synthetase
MAKKFYITTAIAYPNSSPHLGHTLEIVQADALARFHKLLGKDVFFQTGTDEHGLKNYQTAQKQGKDTLEFLDNNVAVFKDLYKQLNIEYDNFIRTTNKKVHYTGATKLWKKLVESEDIYKKKYKGLYCTGCEAFKTEKELENGKCPNHPTRDIESVEEENYFFKLEKYKEKVIKIIQSDVYKVIPKSRKNEILSFLKEAKDISFSRPKSTLPWGIPVSEDPSQIMYVWCDALSNYITGVGYSTDQQQFKKTWPADIHIIGKDILRFHAAFWPAMLISANLQLPKKLFVHGFILSKGTKMGKSTGNVIEPFQQIKKYGVDQLRFYILSAMPLEGDGEYSEDILVDRINTELVGNLSNFCYRVISFTNKNHDSKFKTINKNKVTKEIEEKIKQIKKAYEKFDFKKAIDEILAVSAIGNKYFQDNEPWKQKNKAKVNKVLGTCINIAKNLSILIGPIMPKFSEELQKQLNVADLKWKDLNFNLKNHKVNKAEMLFKKMEETKQEQFPLNLKVAEIKEVNDHPDADKLLVLKIDLGTEKRQLVAGLKEHYKKDELIGKKIVVVTNLKPAKLRGVESQGMLLAASNKETCGVLLAKGSEPGTKVKAGDLESSEEQITFDNFLKLEILLKDNKITYNDQVLATDKEDIKADKEAKFKDNTKIS